MIEAFLLDVTGEYDEDKLFHGVNIYEPLVLWGWLLW